MATFTAVVMAIVLYIVYALDDWLGVLDFKYQYLGICALLAGAIALVWLAQSRRSSLIVGLTAFTLLVTPYFMSEPSSRILRGVLNEVEAGMPADQVEEMVRRAYRESSYAMPRVNRDHNRIHVSLLTQDAGDCTAAIFHLANGVVVKDEFSAD